MNEQVQDAYRNWLHFHTGELERRWERQKIGNCMHIAKRHSNRCEKCGVRFMDYEQDRLMNRTVGIWTWVN